MEIPSLAPSTKLKSGSRWCSSRLTNQGLKTAPPEARPSGIGLERTAELARAPPNPGAGWRRSRTGVR